MSIEQNECSFALTSLKLALMIVYFLLMNSKRCIDLIAFNGTRLDSGINDDQVQLNNYELIRKDRNRNRGGVCTCLKNHINYKVRTDLMPEGTESIVIETVKPNGKPFAVITACRPPECNPDNFFDSIINSVEMLHHERKEVYKLGDLRFALEQIASCN